MASYNSFEELDCWKKCRRLRFWLNDFINEKIDRRDLDMRTNLRRASRSITRNIAEGFGRYHYKENIQFCRISRGSLFEIKDDLIINVDEHKVTDQDIEEGIQLTNTAIKSLNGYIQYLSKAKNNQ